ncbi:unnamed protein product [Haemonchus placei]|uniref:Uncharacterized protein n=1 Tax=Haemonchus placei TaxID=6290 RepID=A0A0N4VS64_HAEPC|nr:unnamed protein product [Haemonchus placei]
MILCSNNDYIDYGGAAIPKRFSSYLPRTEISNPSAIDPIDRTHLNRNTSCFCGSVISYVHKSAMLLIAAGFLD